MTSELAKQTTTLEVALPFLNNKQLLADGENSNSNHYNNAINSHYPLSFPSTEPKVKQKKAKVTSQSELGFMTDKPSSTSTVFCDSLQDNGNRYEKRKESDLPPLPTKVTCLPSHLLPIPPPLPPILGSQSFPSNPYVTQHDIQYSRSTCLDSHSRNQISTRQDLLPTFPFPSTSHYHSLSLIESAYTPTINLSSSSSSSSIINCNQPNQSTTMVKTRSQINNKKQRSTVSNVVDKLPSAARKQTKSNGRRRRQSSSSSASSLTTSTRKRVPMACESCREYKRKCDGRLPCALCIQRKRANICVYEPGPSSTLAAPNRSVSTTSTLANSSILPPARFHRHSSSMVASTTPYPPIVPSPFPTTKDAQGIRPHTSPATIDYHPSLAPLLPSAHGPSLSLPTWNILRIRDTLSTSPIETLAKGYNIGCKDDLIRGRSHSWTSSSLLSQQQQHTQPNPSLNLLNGQQYTPYQTPTSSIRERFHQSHSPSSKPKTKQFNADADSSIDMKEEKSIQRARLDISIPFTTTASESLVNSSTSATITLASSIPCTPTSASISNMINPCNTAPFFPLASTYNANHTMESKSSFGNLNTLVEAVEQDESVSKGNKWTRPRRSCTRAAPY